MLYVYEAYEDYVFNKTDEQIKTIRNHKDLKEWDESHYIGKEKSIDGIKADWTFKEFIKYYWQECVCKEQIDIKIPLINHEIWLPTESIIDNFIENEAYMDRIFNADNPFTETETIINLIATNLLNLAIENLKNKIQ